MSRDSSPDQQEALHDERPASRLCYSARVIRSLPLKALVGCVILATLCAPAAAGKSPKPMPVFVPDTRPDSAPALHGTTWIGEADDYALWVKQVDDQERLAYVKRVTGLEIDPFSAPPDKAQRFLSFLLVLENRGTANLEFNPLKTWLVTNKDEIRTPLGMTDISFVYRMHGMELPAAYERFEPALLNMPRSVAPDESTSGLLIYKAIDPRTRRFSVDVRVSMPDGEVVHFSAPYRRLTKKELEAGRAGDAP